MRIKKQNGGENCNPANDSIQSTLDQMRVVQGWIDATGSHPSPWTATTVYLRTSRIHMSRVPC